MPVRIETPMLLPRLRDNSNIPEPSVRYFCGSVQNANALTGVNRKAHDTLRNATVDQCDQTDVDTSPTSNRRR